MERLYVLYNKDVLAALEADPELALVFYSHFAPYDPDIDPTFNREWVERWAKLREQQMLDEARASLAMAKTWLHQMKPSTL